MGWRGVWKYGSEFIMGVLPETKPVADRSSPVDELTVSGRAFDFMAGGGELGRLVRAHDWSKTPLGRPQQWPQNLQTAVSTCLHCSFPIVTWWGRDLILIYNDAYCSIVANKHPRALGHRGEDCWREVWPLVGPMLERVLDQAQPFTADDLLLMVERHGYSEECYFCFSYSPVFDESGAVSGVFCPVIETTDKIVGARRLETLRELAALRRAETVKGACQQAIAVLTKNGRDVPFASLYLLSEDGQTVSLTAATAGSSGNEAMVPLAQVAQWPLAGALAKPTLLDHVADSELPVGDWSQPPQQVYLSPIILPGSQRARAILVIGLNPHKRLDQPYRSFLELLVSQVASTVADTLAYEAERERAEALAEIDRAKTRFFSNVSHEFRTPLTLMLGPLEDALADPDLPPTEHERLDIARRNSLRLLKLVNSLLDFSRIEAGRAQAVFEPVDLATLTADLASNFRSAFERAGLRLSVECSPLPAPVYVDRDMWEKIVLNLLSNAFKFTFEGKIEVALRALDDRVALTVRDTGVGIPETELPRLFERFHRVEGQRSRTYEGSGIGLALVQELVKLHGGEIGAESAAERGTCFTVLIPFGTLPSERIGAEKVLAPTSVRAEAYVEEALRWLPGDPTLPSGVAFAAEDPTGASLPAGARVLIADDNADMRAYIRRLLAPRCAVETVADGEEALAAMRSRRFDLVLADIMMPSLDGLGLVQAVRADPALRELPVVLLSARAGEESRVEGLQAGADDYLVKPFSGRELIARVSTNLQLSNVRREAAEALRQSEVKLRESQENLRAALAASGTCTFRWNPRTGEFWAFDDSLKQLFGFAPDERVRIFEDCLRKVHPDDLPRVISAVNACHYGADFEMEYRVLLQDCSIRWLYARAKMTRNAEGLPTDLVGACTDITGRKHDEERRDLLLGELNHRVKNTLATVQSLAMQTLRKASSLAEGRATFDARLIALSKAHDVLVREHWAGAGLHEVLTGTLAAYVGGAQDPRLTFSGPEMRLQPKAALALSMALHELATNAVKYGALSNATGKVAVSWGIYGIDRQEFELRWMETGGPPVLAPRKRGFGSRLIEQGLSQELAGDVQLQFASRGVICTIRALLDEIRGGFG
jgi:signal transduction histidine kinase/DNA-binding NarL/FixJ family response regulator